MVDKVRVALPIEVLALALARLSTLRLLPLR